MGLLAGRGGAAASGRGLFVGEGCTPRPSEQADQKWLGQGHRSCRRLAPWPVLPAAAACRVRCAPAAARVKSCLHAVMDGIRGSGKSVIKPHSSSHSKRMGTQSARNSGTQKCAASGRRVARPARRPQPQLIGAEEAGWANGTDAGVVERRAVGLLRRRRPPLSRAAVHKLGCRKRRLQQRGGALPPVRCQRHVGAGPPRLQLQGA